MDVDNATETQKICAAPEERLSKKPRQKTRAQFMYDTLLDRFPAPGGGGAHMAIFKAGALGYRARKTIQEIIEEVAVAVPPGGRQLKPNEIEQGVTAGFDSAMSEALGIKTTGAGNRPPENVRTRDVSPDVFRRIVAANAGVTAEDIIAKSPVPLDFPEWEAGWRTLDALFAPNDIIWTGELNSVHAGRSSGELIAELKKRPPRHPFIIPNPVSSTPATSKSSGTPSFRCDGSVVKHMHAVAEMDCTTIADQLAFWSFAALPVRALIMSGGKSIHAWVDVDCADADEWDREVRGVLFGQFLEPLGCDDSCKNSSRLSRMPGHTRGPGDKHAGALQRLLWLSPEGKAVCE